MSFEQTKTMVGRLVDFTVDMFENSHTTSDNARLLVVISDGRGIFSEGADYVNRCVRRAKLANIFLVFIIVDNPTNKASSFFFFFNREFLKFLLNFINFVIFLFLGFSIRYSNARL